MRKFVRFAASFLSALLLSASWPVLAADLRPLKEPAQIAGVFSPKAKVRVLNVWAMWCLPCVEELPDLRAIDASFGPEVSMAGVSLDDMIPDAKQAQTASFLDKQKIVFPNIYYTGNADALGDQLDFNGEIPITIVYDAKGKELYRHEGRIDREKLTARLRDILRRIR
jgi:thiol-disulfide isomerase/thioredoxin